MNKDDKETLKHPPRENVVFKCYLSVAQNQDLPDYSL